jgi:MFS family permease
VLVLRQHPDFFKLWAGQVVSAFGSRITAVAMPLAAVVVLHASPLEMGVLSALAVLPHLLFGLIAGLWVDRIRRRTLLVVADLGRAVIVGTIPVLSVAGVLRIEHLYAVAFLSGALTLVFDTAATSFVPALVGRANLLRANSLWVLNLTIANTAGPSLAGALVQLLTAPLAIAFDAASFVVSAGCSRLISIDPAPVEAGSGPGRVGWWSEMLRGPRTLFGNVMLGPITVSAMVGALAGAMQSALIVLYLVRDLSFTPTLVGLALAATGLSSVVGALLAPSVSERLGPGPSLLNWRAVDRPGRPGPGNRPGRRGGHARDGRLRAGAGRRWSAAVQYSANERAAERGAGPNATWRFLVFGVQPVGAVLGGAMGGSIGLRATLLIGSAVMLTGVLWALRSPVRSLRQLPSSPS